MTDLYEKEKDNMDTLMNFAGTQCFIDCQRPNVGYYIKLLHDGIMDNRQVTYVDNNEEEGTTFEALYPDVRGYGSYKAYGFLVIKVLPNNRMPDTLDEAMIQGKVFLVNENGQFGADATIPIDMREEVGINVDDDERILKISLEELRRVLAYVGAVFQAREE